MLLKDIIEDKRQKNSSENFKFLLKTKICERYQRSQIYNKIQLNIRA